MKPENRVGHLLLMLIGLALPTLITWIYFDVCRESAPWIQQVAYGTGKVFQFLLPIVAVYLATDRAFSFHRPRKEGMRIGVGFGLLVTALIFGIYYWRLVGHPMLEPLETNLLEKVSGFGVNNAWKFLLMGLWYSIFHSLFEEYYWRWFVFPQCKRFFPLWIAILVSSLGFMSHHVLVLAFYLGWDSLFTYQVSGCIAVGGGLFGLGNSIALGRFIQSG